MRRFECTEGGAAKFWEVAVEATSLTVRWGRLGTSGQSKTKAFAHAAAAAAEMQKLIREKLRKGYVAVRAARAAAAPGESTPLGDPVEPETADGPPIRHARERVVRQVRVRHLARAIGAQFYGDASFFAGDDRVGQFLDHDGCGNHVAVCWDESGVAAIAFDHESSHRKPDATDTWKKHFAPPPPELEALCAMAFEGSNRQATETFWISAGPNPRWASRLDGYDTMLDAYAMTPEAVFFSSVLMQTWLEFLGLDESHARLAIRLAEASSRGPVTLTAADVRVLTAEPAVAEEVNRCDYDATVAALALAGVHWRRRRPR